MMIIKFWIIIGLAYIAAIPMTLLQVYYQRTRNNFRPGLAIHFLSVWLLMPWFILYRIFICSPREFIKKHFGK